MFAFVDDADYELVSRYKWRARISKGTAYAIHRKRSSGRAKDILLHRLIIDAPDGSLVDHIDGDPMNNRRCNLRICTAAGNARNIVNSKNRGNGGFKGVYWHKRMQKWLAQIGFEYRTIYIGSFHDPKEAALAYDFAARRLFGAFACPNFPLEAA